MTQGIDYSGIRARKVLATVEKYNPQPDTPCANCGVLFERHYPGAYKCLTLVDDVFDPVRASLTPEVVTVATWLTPEDTEVTDPGAIADLERRLALITQEGE
jgi:hypothetical protein